jgi:hypothetical protein
MGSILLLAVVARVPFSCNCLFIIFIALRMALHISLEIEGLAVSLGCMKTNRSFSGNPLASSVLARA